MWILIWKCHLRWQRRLYGKLTTPYDNKYFTLLNLDDRMSNECICSEHKREKDLVVESLSFSCSEHNSKLSRRAIQGIHKKIYFHSLWVNLSSMKAHFSHAQIITLYDQWWLNHPNSVILQHLSLWWLAEVHESLNQRMEVFWCKYSSDPKNTFLQWEQKERSTVVFLSIQMNWSSHKIIVYVLLVVDALSYSFSSHNRSTRINSKELLNLGFCCTVTLL
jgi:hypothetical protein